MKFPPFKLERFFAKYEFKAPYLLCASDCESMTVEDLLSLEPGAEQQFHQTWLGYTQAQGDPELRQAIAQTYQTIGTDNVLVHAGAEEAIFIFMNVALQPGDHVIVHFPCYQSHESIARSIGCEVTWWKSEEANNWELDPNWLQTAIQPNTKAIVINCPHNPTGYVMSPATLEEYCSAGRTIFFCSLMRSIDYWSIEMKTRYQPLAIYMRMQFLWA